VHCCLLSVARFVVGCSVLLTDVRGGRCGTFVICVLFYSGSCKGHGLHLVSSCVKVCMVSSCVKVCMMGDWW
jgi:hypothetical protein